MADISKNKADHINDVIEEDTQIITDNLVTTQATNVQFQDSKNVVEETGNTGGDILTNSLAGLRGIQENPWSVSQVMSRPLRTFGGSWDKTQVVGTKLATLRIPEDILPDGSMALGVLRQFSFFRSGFRFRLQVNGTRFHQGRVAMFFAPNINDVETHLDLYRCCISTMPHVFLDASESNSGELVVPYLDYAHFRNINNLIDDVPLGRLFIVVFNQLNAADSASPELGITLWSSFENCDLKVPSFSKFLAQSGRSLQQSEGLLGSLFNGVISGIGSTIKSGVDSIIPGGGQVLKDMFRDKPNINAVQNPIISKTTSNLAYGVGVDNSDRLSLFPFSSTQNEVEVSTEVEDMQDLRKLVQIPSFYKTITWSDGQVAGTVLHTESADPHFVDFVVEGGHTVSSPSLLTYVSRPFGRWAGSLKMRLEFIATQFHTGRLLIAFVPGDFDDLDINTAMNAPNVVVDLQEAHEFDFEIPWVSKTPMKQNAPSLQPILTEEYSTGRVHIFVLNRLVRPDNVASSIDINLFVAGGDDYTLFMPRSFPAPQKIVPFGAEDIERSNLRFVAQHGSLVDSRTGKTKREPKTLQFGVGKISDTIGIVGEDFMDLRAVLRRYYFLEKLPFLVNSTTNYTVYNIGVNPVFSNLETDGTGGLISPLIRSTDMISWFAQIFRYWKGSLR